MSCVVTNELHRGLSDATIKVIDRAQLLGLRLVCSGDMPRAPGTGLPRGHLLGFFSDSLCAWLQREELPLVALFPVDVLLIEADKQQTTISARDPRSCHGTDTAPEAVRQLSGIVKELVLGPFSS